MEDVLGFKFSLDLSDLDQAPEKIGEVLQKVADKARKEGKDVDTEIKNFLDSFTADYRQQAAEMEKVVDNLKEEREALKKTLNETDLGSDDWANIFDALTAKDEALSDMEDKLDPIKNGLQTIAETSQSIQEWSQQYNYTLEEAGRELQKCHDEAMDELAAEREKEQLVEGIKGKYEAIKDAISDKVEATKEWVSSLFSAKEATNEVAQAEDKANEKGSGFFKTLLGQAKGADAYSMAMKKLPSPIANVIKSNQALDLSLKKLLANPIVALIAAVVAAIMALVGAMKGLGQYADFLSERFEGVAYVFGVVTEAARKVWEVTKAIFSADYESLMYNLKTMYDGGEREIEKRNEKVLKADHAFQKQLHDQENHWLRKRMNNQAIDIKDRLNANAKYMKNRLDDLKNANKDMEGEYKRFLDSIAYYDPKYNKRGTKTRFDQLSKDEQEAFINWQAKFRANTHQQEMIVAEAQDQATKLREQQRRKDEQQKKEEERVRKEQEDAFKKRQEYNRYVREALEKENRRLEKLGKQNENKTLQAQINDMADGIEKAAKQAELTSKQALESLDDALYNEALNLYNTQKDIFTRNPDNEGKNFGGSVADYMAQAAQNIDYAGNKKRIADNEQKSVKKAIDNQLKDYQTYADKRLEIEKKASEDRIAIQRAGLKGTEKEEKAELDRIKKLFAVDLEEFNNGGFVNTALENISTLSKQSLETLEKELENFEMGEAMKGLYSDEVKDQIDELRDKIEEAKTPYKSLGDAINDVKNAQYALNKARKEGDPEKIVKAEAKLAKATETANGKYEDTMSAISGCADAVGRLGEQIGGVTGGIMQLMPDVVGVVSSVGQAMKVVTSETVAALKAIETASIILEIISLVVQLGEAIAAMFNARKEEEKRTEEWKQNMLDIYNSVADAVYAYKQALIEAKYAQEDLWSGTNIGSMQKTIEQLDTAKERYEELVSLGTEQRTLKNVYGASKLFQDLTKNGVAITDSRREKGSGVGVDTLFDFTGSFYDTLETGYQDIYHRGVSLKQLLEERGMAQLFNELGEFDLKAYQALRENAEDAWNGIAEVDRQQLEQLAKVAEEYESLKQQLAQSMADWYSPLLDNMTDAWMNWLQTGEDVMDSFRDYSSDTFNNIIKDILKKKLFDQAFNAFNEDIEAYTNEYLNGGTDDMYATQVANRTEELMKLVDRESETYEKVLNAYNEALQSKGIDITGDSNRSSEARGIARASQESVDENNARLAMMQQHTYSINANVSQLVSMSATALEHLAGIHQNTNRLERIEKTLLNIETYGIKTK